MRRPISDNSPVVLKIGSSSLAAPSSGVDTEAIHKVVDQVEALWRLGHPTVLVTSGAVAAGLPALGLTERPTDIPGLQVAAAVGQGRLMAMYATEFESKRRQVGQVLLTKEVLSRREQYLNAREALGRMLSGGRRRLGAKSRDHPRRSARRGNGSGKTVRR